MISFLLIDRHLIYKKSFSLIFAIIISLKLCYIIINVFYICMYKYDLYIHSILYLCILFALRKDDFFAKSKHLSSNFTGKFRPYDFRPALDPAV